MTCALTCSADEAKLKNLSTLATTIVPQSCAKLCEQEVAPTHLADLKNCPRGHAISWRNRHESKTQCNAHQDSRFRSFLSAGKCKVSRNGAARAGRGEDTKFESTLQRPRRLGARRCDACYLRASRPTLHLHSVHPPAHRSGTTARGSGGGASTVRAARAVLVVGVVVRL